MDIKDIKESFQKKPIGWIFGVLIIAIIIIPLIVTFTISVRNPIFSFNESNGWLGFWGSYLGGILGGLATLMAVVITTNQTRVIQEENKEETREIQKENKNIQNKLIELNENKLLYDLRTIVQDVYIEDNFELKDHRKAMNIDILYLNKSYENLFEKAEYLSRKQKECGEEKKEWESCDDVFCKQICNNLVYFDKYRYLIIKNIGKNPMCYVEIILIGTLCNVNNTQKEKKEQRIKVDFINSNNNVAFPMFEIDDKNEIWNFYSDKSKIIYFTNITGKRERVTLESEQIGEEIKIKTSFEIEDSELKSWEEDASKVMYLQKG
ncbi:TPA: hypothetical protein ACKOO2_003604 [Clostridioides difficile]|uniref:hypothetical protein n=1 Tax=Clostridioides difficile TaxID=1496 RepID=UPI0003B2AF87|nr:hypothetical protein [Clostridioides difficile]MBY1152833.1 hypothetical protein [Clostridioides difficile]MBY1283030.1 hypothetical protein [Clostridioides difficile]MCI4241351.1 hypothetical protein [Clostridioides difficile]MCR1522601.1 hypothetical protein [Clostridioides difficile]MDB9600440.1 hypothetical protein [Clostridioides difficile]